MNAIKRIGFVETADATVSDLIRRERKPLPPHDLCGCNYRKWAMAVCNAEVAHRGRDFARVERLLGFNFDRWTEPTCETWGQFQHEAFAGDALVWLSHLQTHESARDCPFDGKPWREWAPSDRKASSVCQALNLTTADARDLARALIEAADHADKMQIAEAGNLGEAA